MELQMALERVLDRAQRYLHFCVPVVSIIFERELRATEDEEVKDVMGRGRHQGSLKHGQEAHLIFGGRIKKSDGKLYPPGAARTTIADSRVPGIKFNILADPGPYGEAAANEAVERSPAAGLDKTKHKDVLTIDEERMILVQEKCSVHNPTGRVIGISSMEEANAPTHIGMKQTGHQDVKSYAKYNQGEAEIHNCAAQRIIGGETRDDGKHVLFEEAFQEEREKYESIKVMVLFC
ncbi:hypothetical protein R1flu_014690 [Riccia fluitans]|uniref:Uncharacterized protein n=1 Tax=Riccia fluitans TaxID=41844 RepID=A0ABD1YGT5_9MARC